jgi:hypothetical protein
MLEIEGTEYRRCGCCLNWCPAGEMRWDDELLDWECVFSSCAPA